MDILGLKTLSIIKDALSMIEKRHKVKLDYNSIPINTKEQYELYHTSNLLGVFQLENQGMTKFSQEFKPKDFEEVAFVIAAYRPGPMQFLEDINLIKRGLKWKNLQPPAEMFPAIKDILEPTWGYLIYQEQVQAVARKLADYNDAESVDFMKLFAKKQREKLAKERKRFEPKALAKGLTPDEVDKLWGLLEDFASYAFNKSHAICYADISVKTAWIKVNYPAEFYAANIKHEIGNIEKVVPLINEAKNNFGIELLQPDINESDSDFTVVSNDIIRYGLSGIKGIGHSVTEPIIEQRRIKPFTSVSDFAFRTNASISTLNGLASAGAFSKFAFRSQLLHLYPDNETYLMKLSKLIRHMRNKQYLRMISDYKELIPLPAVEEFDSLQIMNLENEASNTALTVSLFDIYRSEILKHKNKTAGIVSGFYQFKSKKGFGFTMRLENGTVYKCLAFSWAKLDWDDFKDIKVETMAVANLKKFKDEEGVYSVAELEILKTSEKGAALFPIHLNSMNFDEVKSALIKMRSELILTAGGRDTSLCYFGSGLTFKTKIGHKK